MRFALPVIVASTLLVPTILPGTVDAQVYRGHHGKQIKHGHSKRVVHRRHRARRLRRCRFHRNRRHY